MSETKHTAKYTYEKHTPIDGDYWLIFHDGRLIGKTFNAEEASQIVGVLNACAGIPDKVLAAPGYSIKAELDSLDAQIEGRLRAERERDQFRARLAALEDVATGLDADIDAGRPLEYNVEHLRDELIRTREALGILPEQESGRPKKGHDVQYPGQIYDLGEFRRVPELPRRCNIVPVITENQEDRPVEPNNTGEYPEQWAAIAAWESVRADRAEAALREAADRAVLFYQRECGGCGEKCGECSHITELRAAIMRNKL